jgi:hypothetical protein
MQDKAKLTQLTSELLEKTRKNKIRWRRSTDQGMYSATIKDKFLVSVLSEANLRNFKRDIRLYMWDGYDLLIATVLASELENPSLLEELYEVIQKKTPQNGQKDKVTAFVETLRNL